MNKLEFKFKIYAGKKVFERTNLCDSVYTAEAEARGMMYAMYFLYKRPFVEIYKRDGFSNEFRYVTSMR